MNYVIECDNCNKHIASNQLRIEDITIKPGLQKRVWKCVHCDYEHLIMITNKKTRRMMKENKEDRERIGKINRRSQLLRKQNNFTSGQAKKALSDMEKIEERIKERTKELDELSRELMDDYILSLGVDQ